MTYSGILVDVNYCTGCLSCVLACQQEHDFADDQYGIQITKLGPIQIAETHYQYDFIPQFTEWCDLCAERTGMGKPPTCVSHCQSRCMQYGPVEELSKRVFGTKQMIVALKED